MHISNRLIVILAIVSGLAVVILIAKTPGIAQVQVCVAAKSVGPGDPLDAGRNLRPEPESMRKAQTNGYIPFNMAALVGGRHSLVALKEGDRLTLDDFVPSKKPGDGQSVTAERFFRLSGLLKEGQCAVAVNSSALTSLGYALEPGDQIDIVMPAANGNNTAFRHLNVLAVGGRTAEGWVTPGPHEDRYDTITLAVPEGDAEQLAGVFALVGSARPCTVLRPRP